MPKKPLPLYPPNNLKLIRESECYTQQEVVDELSIPKSSISRHENSYREIKPIYMRAYCALFRVTQKDVFDVSKPYTRKLERIVTKRKKAEKTEKEKDLALSLELASQTEKPK